MLAEYGAAIGGWATTLGGSGGGTAGPVGVVVLGVAAVLLMWFLSR